MAKRGRVARPNRRPAPRRRFQPWWAMGIMALLAACAVAIWLAGRTVGNAGSNAPLVPSPTPGIAVARPTPEPPEMVAAAERRPLPTTGGKPIAVRDYLGRRVVLAFYAEST